MVVSLIVGCFPLVEFRRISGDAYCWAHVFSRCAHPSPSALPLVVHVFEQTYGRRPVNQDEMVMWLKSSEYRAAIRPHLDADGKIIA
jgi:hypothetical protein